MKPVDANQFLLSRRKVRGKLFMQANIIQYFYDVNEGSSAQEEARDRRVSRLSFSTPVPPARYSSAHRL